MAATVFFKFRLQTEIRGDRHSGKILEVVEFLSHLKKSAMATARYCLLLNKLYKTLHLYF